MTWGKKTVAGVEYDLTHLDSFVFTVTPQAPAAQSYRVLVSFGCHCFAREPLPTDHADYHVKDGSKTRCLCPTRTAHSIHLPGIVTKASTGNAFFSQSTHMLLVEQLPGLNGPYAIFFSVRPSRKKNIDVVMFVASAYEKPLLPRQLPAVPFTALIAHASQGSAPFKPTRLTRW